MFFYIHVYRSKPLGFRSWPVLGILTLWFSTSKGQQFVTVSGTVYDITARNPIEAVSVFSTSGRGTVTDSMGRYSFTVKGKDSIWFSLLGKATRKYAVDTIANPSNFDLSVHVSANELPPVTVRNKSYHIDSLQNRKEYKKYFEFKKPSLKLSNNYVQGRPLENATVGLDLDEIINAFRFKRTRNLLFLQKRLLQQEQDGYVNSRFTKSLVRKLTQLQGPALEEFVKKHRPSYELLETFNDLELGLYIEMCFEQQRSQQRKIPTDGKPWKPDEVLSPGN